MSSTSENRAQPLFLQPQTLTANASRWVLLAVAIAIVLGLFLLDALTPKSFTFSFMTLAIFPIILVAWQLALRHLVALMLITAGLTVVLGAVGELEWYRVFGQTATAVTVATMSRLAAVQSSRLRQSRERELAFLLDTARSLQPGEGVQGVITEVVRATTAFVGSGARVQVVRTDDPAAAGAAALRLSIPAGAVEYRLLVGGAPDLTPEQRRVVDGIVDVARLALADASKLEAERARARIFETLHEFAISAALAESPEAVAELMVGQTVRLLEDSQAVLAWQQAPGEPLRVLAASGAPVRLIVDARSGPAATAMREQRTLVMSGATSAGDLEDLLEGEVSSVLVAPLLVKGTAKGVLIIGSSQRASDEDVMALSLLSAQTAPILNDARLRYELEQSERRYRSLYHSFGCGVVIHDAAGRLADCNWAAEDTLGLSAADLQKHSPFGPEWRLVDEAGHEVPPPMRPPANVITFRRPLRRLVARVSLGEGPERWLRIDSSPVEDGHDLKMVVTSFFPVPPPNEL